MVAFLLITFNLSTLKVSCSEEFSSFNNTPKAISFSIQNVAWQWNSLIKYFFFFYSQFFVTKYRFFPLHASSVNHQGRYILFVYYFLTFTYKKRWSLASLRDCNDFCVIVKKINLFCRRYNWILCRLFVVNLCNIIA